MKPENVRLRLVTYNPESLTEFNNSVQTFESFLNFKSRKSENVLRKLEKERYITSRWAEEVNISISPIPQNLLLLAIDYYKKAPNELELVLFVRHQFTNYEKLLDVCRKCIGFNNAYEIIKTRVTKEVCKVLGIKFSIEYVLNTRLDWVIDKENCISMYG